MGRWYERLWQNDVKFSLRSSASLRHRRRKSKRRNWIFKIREINVIEAIIKGRIRKKGQRKRRADGKTKTPRWREKKTKKGRKRNLKTTRRIMTRIRRRCRQNILIIV
jgi:hypothetical protein